MGLTIILSLVLTVLISLYFWIKRNYKYWENKNVPHEKPTFLFGSYAEHFLQKKSIGEVTQELCKRFPKEPYIGTYYGTEPVLVVKDPEIIKLVTTKEFAYFNSRELENFGHKETFGRSLVLASGEDWKFTRTNLAPMFTSAKLKNMFHLIEDCAVDFEKYLAGIDGKPMEARRLMASYTMSTFVSCAFGIDLKKFGKRDTFHEIGDMFFQNNWLKSILLHIRSAWPKVFYGLGFRNIPLDMNNFLEKVLADVFESKGYKPSARKDFVDALLGLKETAGKVSDKFDDDYILAQCMAIFAGGFETSATTVSFLLYEIAKHEKIQAKVHQEIDEYFKKTDGKITYDCVTEFPYLSACIDETLRMYPIIGIITREVTANYTMQTGLKLEKGLRVHLPLYYLHHNPKYFPKPDEFRPERFYGENKQQIVPYSYLPFGEGPRICIGKRFAMLQSLPGILAVLRNHKVVLADGMPTKITIDPRCNQSLPTQALGGIHLRFLPRDSS